MFQKFVERARERNNSGGARSYIMLALEDGHVLFAMLAACSSCVRVFCFWFFVVSLLFFFLPKKWPRPNWTKDLHEANNSVHGFCHCASDVAIIDYFTIRFLHIWTFWEKNQNARMREKCVFQQSKCWQESQWLDVINEGGESMALEELRLNRTIKIGNFCFWLGREFRKSTIRLESPWCCGEKPKTTSTTDACCRRRSSSIFHKMFAECHQHNHRSLPIPFRFGLQTLLLHEVAPFIRKRKKFNNILLSTYKHHKIHISIL